MNELIDIERMYKYLDDWACGNRMTQSQRALPFVREKHAGQMRKSRSGEKIPYIIHPLTMACHALCLGINDDSVIATCLLHDVCEDCDVLPEELPVSLEVEKAVKALSFVAYENMSRQESKKTYYKKMKRNQLACLVKLFDRCHNVSCMAVAFSVEKMKEYIEETRNDVLPLADLLCEDRSKYQMQIFALKYQIESLIDSLEAILSY